MSDCLNCKYHKTGETWRDCKMKCLYRFKMNDKDIYQQIQAKEQKLKKIKDIAEELALETPEYDSCYYKYECGLKCTPKKRKEIDYCCYENVHKILQIIEE